MALHGHHQRGSLTVRDLQDEDDPLDEEKAVYFWKLPRAFTCKRHVEKIESIRTCAQTWRMKERMKTVSVALVICLNIGVDPPDVVKLSPCARLECWMDPLQLAVIDVTSNANQLQKPIDVIGMALQKQYERWQPRARYKSTLDPTTEDVKKLCVSLRRNAKDERVLFHYNGHGVPRPTANGEIWCFNKHFTQYIPLSVIDLQMWMGSPSVFVFDCSSAGNILNYLKNYAAELRFSHTETSDSLMSPNSGIAGLDEGNPTNFCIYLGACQGNELLPMNPELPADLFTSCLTTPIKIALRWFVLMKTSKLVPSLTLQKVDEVPGALNDRRTMLGELNWIFTAITDTIAWNVLPRELFQKLFRQDLLVASLFRNFLLAERIMRSYNCTPVSTPKIPPMHQHPMWEAWDLALDSFLLQLPQVLRDPNAYEPSQFFSEQLTVFEVWLNYGSARRSPPEQLPIVLQVLLSQAHRQRALELLGRFLDLGPWAVNLALSVGIFPYVLKLLQSSAKELRPLLVFIWAKVLAVDSSCQNDLVKDNGHKYFLSVLSDPAIPAEHRMMAVFVLTLIVDNHRLGQEVALQGNIIALCSDQLTDQHAMLRQWLALCLGKVWTNYDEARWCGVRDTAHERLYPLLSDPIPEVRAAAVFALGTFMDNSTERSDHINMIDQSIANTLLLVVSDGSPIVRKELSVALGGFVSQFETQFAAIAFQFSEEESAREYHTVTGTTSVYHSPNEAALFPGSSGMRRSTSVRCFKGMMSPIGPAMALGVANESDQMKRIASTSSMMSPVITGHGNVYGNVWKALLHLSGDNFSSVADLAKKLISYVRHKVPALATVGSKLVNRQRKASAPLSAPSSPSNRPGLYMPKAGETASKNNGNDPNRPNTLKLDQSATLPQNESSFLRTRKVTDVINEKDDGITKTPLLSTDFFPWCCKYFTESLMQISEHSDPHGQFRQEQDYRYTRAAKFRRIAEDEQQKAKCNKLDELIFINRNIEVPGVLRFHPYEPHLAVGGKDHISIWDWEQGTRICSLPNRNSRYTRITYAEFINAHDQSLLMTGSDDGAVRVWRNYCSSNISAPELVSSWWALSDMIPTAKGSGMVMDWDERSGLLYASGDCRFIKIWDTQSELKIQDLPTGLDSCITSLSLDLSGNIIVGGGGDGSVRVFDKRLPNSECVVRVFREHATWVVRAKALHGFPNRVASASTNGDICLWDLRTNESLQTINTSAGLTAMDAHHYGEVIASGSVSHSVSAFNHAAEHLSNVKYHQGFMGQKIGPVTCLAFHPIKVKLAVASDDQFVCVYACQDFKKR